MKYDVTQCWIYHSCRWSWALEPLKIAFHLVGRAWKCRGPQDQPNRLHRLVNADSGDFKIGISRTLLISLFWIIVWLKIFCKDIRRHSQRVQDKIWGWAWLFRVLWILQNGCQWNLTFPRLLYKTLVSIVVPVLDHEQYFLVGSDVFLRVCSEGVPNLRG